MKEKELRKLRPRAILLFWLIMIASGILVARLYVVQVRDAANLAAYAGEEQRARFDVVGRRGDVTDRFGVLFATSIPSSKVFAQPPSVQNPRHVARLLAPLLGQPVEAIERALTEKVRFEYLAFGVPQPIADRIEALGVRGIGTEKEPTGIRRTPQGAIGSTVVGFTGSDDQGLAGVEYGFDAQLAGKPGTIVAETDSAGLPIPFGRRTVRPPLVGDTVVLTLDRALQFSAERILTQTVRTHDAADGSIIIMRANTGEILALANYPNFDPSHFAASPPAAWRDRAISDPYEPGSTFKVVTATAALDSGLVSLDDTFIAANRIETGGYTIYNADDGLASSGRVYETLGDIVTYSHNVGAAQVARRIGKATMYRYIKRFGFDDVTGVDLPGESAGIVGTPDNWWGSRLATIGFGQGVSVTALALARAYCAIANGGLLMRPLIAREIISPTGRVVRRYSPQVIDRVMKPQTAAQLLAILRNVVRRGTGTGAQIPGFAVAGKTGTAQMVIDGSYIPGAYTSSFIGIVPADRPQYVVLVKIDQPRGLYYGGLVAAPAFKELAIRLLWREGLLPRSTTGANDSRTSYEFLSAPSSGNAPSARARFDSGSALQGNAPGPW